MTPPVQNEYYNPWKTEHSHTLNTTKQQHIIGISITITTIKELELTTGENYPDVDTLLETLGNNSLWGGRVGKLLHCPARKEKLIHVTKRETDILTRTQVPHFV